MIRPDTVIEAVRYRGNRIDLVRAYERRGPTYSDRVLLDRATLVARLREGRRVATGQRTELLAGTFEIGRQVILAGKDGDVVVTTQGQAERDQLEGVPIF